jgi:hypothetical protein
LALVTCHFLLGAPRAHPPPRLRFRHAGNWLCSRPEAEWGFVMRYRSATVAGLHGLPCDCRIKWKEPQERADTTAAPPHPASPNPVHPLTMTRRVCAVCPWASDLGRDTSPVKPALRAGWRRPYLASLGGPASLRAVFPWRAVSAPVAIKPPSRIPNPGSQGREPSRLISNPRLIGRSALQLTPRWTHTKLATYH